MDIDFDLIILFSLLLIALDLGLNVYWIIKKKRNKKFLKLFISVVLLIAALGITLVKYVTITPQIQNTTPVTEGIWESYDKPIKVIFNMPVDVLKLYENINPKINGDWVWKPYLGIQRLTREGEFYPKETLFPGQRIVIYFTGIGRFGFRDEGHEGGFVFDSPKLPEIIETNPQNKALEVSENQEITLTYDKPVNNLVDINYKFTPNIDFSLNKISDTEFKITPKDNYELSTHYTLQIFRTAKTYNLETNTEIEHDNPVLIHNFEFDTQNEPLISHFSPNGSDIKSDEKIKILFSTAMDRSSVEQNLEIEPNTQGTYNWLNDRALIFTPESLLPKETKYTVTLSSGAKSKSGLTTNKKLKYTFETIGKAAVKEFDPFNGEVKVDEKSQIKITFNQDVDHTSAQEHFSIQPNVAGKYRWKEQTLIFTPSSNLSFSTSYTVKISKGVKSVDGINSTEEFSSQFTIRNNEVIISMPLYYQPQYPVSFSCNIYATKMGLAWKGVDLSITSIISETGHDSSQDAQGRWLADPNQVFVGNSDGSWGYGVYWNPIQKVYTNHGIQTELHTNWNIYDLAKSIENGHPVEIWRYNGTSSNSDLQWGTPGIYAINGQHGGVITGIRGTVDNPQAFYINDPWFGLIWMDSGTFDYYWSRLNRVGLVINRGKNNIV